MKLSIILYFSSLKWIFRGIVVMLQNMTLSPAAIMLYSFCVHIYCDIGLQINRSLNDKNVLLRASTSLSTSVCKNSRTLAERAHAPGSWKRIKLPLQRFWVSLEDWGALEMRFKRINLRRIIWVNDRRGLRGNSFCLHVNMTEWHCTGRLYKRVNMQRRKKIKLQQSYWFFFFLRISQIKASTLIHAWPHVVPQPLVKIQNVKHQNCKC